MDTGELALDWDKLVNTLQQSLHVPLTNNQGNTHEQHQLVILEGIMIFRNELVHT